MEESRSSHRLLRRFALLAVIHGFSATVVGEHLYAADHSWQPRRIETATTSGQICANPFAEGESFSSATISASEPGFVGNWPVESSVTAVNVFEPGRTAGVELEAVQFHVALRLPNANESGANDLGANDLGVDQPNAIKATRLPQPQAEVPVPLPAPSGPMKLPSDKPAQTAEPVAASWPTQPIRMVATRIEQPEPFTALAAMSQSTPPWIQPRLELPSPEVVPTSATMNSSKLRDMARESLRDANSRLKRDATHSAHKIATEALELLIAMSDARDGGTEHARQLESAMTAVRESKDFWSTRGPIDHDTIVRSIAVHETAVLHGKSLENTSALDASAIYLGYAKDQLALAGQSVPEASDALVLLGQIEKRLASPSDPHAAAVALTMHRAAVAVDPSNGYCRRELGKALLNQGLNEEALEELKIANQYQPTRGGFQSLREAALRVGDNQLANQCITAMNDRQLPPDSPVLRLPPEQFAATHRPNAIDLNRSTNATASNSTQQSTSPRVVEPQVLPPQVTDKKSWFPFGRR